MGLQELVNIDQQYGAFFLFCGIGGAALGAQQAEAEYRGLKGRCMVLDPFWGSGTTGLVALSLGRIAWGVELNPEYIEISKRRLLAAQTTLLGRV